VIHGDENGYYNFTIVCQLLRLYSVEWDLVQDGYEKITRKRCGRSDRYYPNIRMVVLDTRARSWDQFWIHENTERYKGLSEVSYIPLPHNQKWRRGSCQYSDQTTNWTTGVRLPCRGSDFSLRHRVQTGSGAHPAYRMGIRGSFTTDKIVGASSWRLTSI
jgi:hypothetical protein